MSRENLAFGPGQPSRTSIVVAALRAFGNREHDANVRNPDYLAVRLLTDEDLQLIAAHPVSFAVRADYEQARQSREVAGMSNLMLVRTRFVDERMQRALDNGAGQVVILGAGFDTRAYRFADVLHNKKVFEVDYRSTQELKKKRLETALGALPAHVRFAEIDFKRDTLADVLYAAGYQRSVRTFFIWEGVSMYLPEHAVRDTLRTISSHSVSGSSVVMDFAGKAMIDALRELPDLSQHKYTTEWGEPWIFGLPDTQEKNFFHECGLELRDVLSFFGSDARKRYLTRSDGTSFGSIRGGSPERQAFLTVAQMMWRFFTIKSQWYALAEAVVP
jgi:methyltransferase (TIGR00027 family)